MAKYGSNDVSIAELRAEHNAYARTEKAFEGSTVPDKYKGTPADKNDMGVLGRKQVSSIECGCWTS